MALKDMLRSSTTDLQINNKTRSITLLTESGLNALILKSKKPYAKKIRIWLTSDVLPAIRKQENKKNFFYT
jgi:prophage antirepressor-like protein